MASLPKYCIKQTPTDVWSTRERLCLASSVLRSGDQNWVSVSRAIRPFGETNRPPDWFSQKNCALQYSDLLEKVETPKRKRGERGEIDTPGDLIVRKLTIERIEELKKIIEEQQRKHKKLKRELEEVKSGQADNKLDELWKKIQEEMKAKEAAELEHQAWLREREAKIAAMKAIPKMVLLGVNKTKRTPRQPKSGEIRRSSSQSELSEQESVVDSPLSETLNLEVEDVSSPLPASSHTEVSQPSTPKQITSLTITTPPQSTPSTSPLLTSLLRSPTPATPASPNFGAMLSSPVTQPKEGATPHVTPRPSSTPQSFFNPTSALATAAARQLAVATASISTNSSQVTSLFPPAKDVGNQVSRSPVHGTPSLAGHSPISSAPTLTMLLEMPPSLPGKLPPLPIISSSSENSESPQKTNVATLTTMTTVASLSSDTNVVDTVATKVIPAVVLPVTKTVDKVKTEPEGTPVPASSSVPQEEVDSVVVSSVKAEPIDTTSGNNSNVTVAPIQEEENGNLPEDNPVVQVEEDKAEENRVEEEHNTIVELIDVIQETEVGDTEMIQEHADQHVVVIKKEPDSVIEVKEEIIEVPEVIETEVVEEVLSVEETVDVVSTNIKNDSKNDEEKIEVDVQEQITEIEEAQVNVSSAVVEPEETVIVSCDGETEMSVETVEISEQIVEESKEIQETIDKEEEIVAAPNSEETVLTNVDLPVDKEESSTVVTEDEEPLVEIEDKTSTPAIHNVSVQEKQPCAKVEPEGEPCSVTKENIEANTGSTKSLPPKKVPVKRGRGRPPKVSREQVEVEVSTSEVTSEIAAVKETKSVLKEACTEKSDKTAETATRETEVPKVEAGEASDENNEKKMQVDECSNKEQEILTENLKSQAAALVADLHSKEKELAYTATKQMEAVDQSEDVGDSSAVSSKLERTHRSGKVHPQSQIGLESREIEIIEASCKESVEEETKPAKAPEVYKRPKAGGKQGTTKEEVAQMHEIKEDSLSGDKIQTPSSATGDSIPNSPASVSQSEDQESIRDYKVWKKAIMLVWRAAATHKYANVFLHPVTNDVAPGYHSIVYRPMDLSTIKKNIESGAIKTTIEFQRDMMLMFQNAIMYNSSDHDVFHMAIEMQKEVMEHIQDFLATQLMVQTNESKSLRIREREKKNEGEKEEDKRKRSSTFSDNETRGKKRRSRADE